MSTSGKVKASVAILVVLIAALVGYFLLSNQTQLPPTKPLATVGVGLYLVRDMQTKKFKIKRIFPNSPAEEAGLIPGLILNKVNGILAEQKNIKELSALLAGPEGTTVIVETIDQSGNSKTMELIRESFVNRSTN